MDNKGKTMVDDRTNFSIKVGWVVGKFMIVLFSNNTSLFLGSSNVFEVIHQ